MSRPISKTEDGGNAPKCYQTLSDNSQECVCIQTHLLQFGADNCVALSVWDFNYFVAKKCNFFIWNLCFQILTMKI